MRLFACISSCDSSKVESSILAAISKVYSDLTAAWIYGDFDISVSEAYLVTVPNLHAALPTN